MFYKRCILVVDANDELREHRMAQLVDLGGFSVLGASTAQEAEARALAQRDTCAAVIVDGAFPDGSGSDLVLRLRRKNLRMPIIYLADAEGDLDLPEVGWFAELSIIKPIAFGVLLEKLIEQLRIYESSDNAVFPVGPYSFRSASRSLFNHADGSITRLAEKEASLLKFLYRARGQIILRQRLLEDIWGMVPSATTHTVETHIYRLRKKLQKNAPNTTFIVTEPGGYRLHVVRRD